MTASGPRSRGVLLRASVAAGTALLAAGCLVGCDAYDDMPYEPSPGPEPDEAVTSELQSLEEPLGGEERLARPELTPPGSR